MAGKPSPRDKVSGCRVWDGDCGDVPEEVGVVPQNSAAVLQTSPVVEDSGFGWLGGHSHLL